VIRVIRGADDTDHAREELMSQFSLSEIQATAILDLRLRALTGLERKRVEQEYADLQERIAELRAILGDPARIDALIREELLELQVDLRQVRRPAHGDHRGRGRVLARGHDRRGGHGDRDHALGLHQAPAR
jgi:DNA gyrase subunit A